MTRGSSEEIKNLILRISAEHELVAPYEIAVSQVGDEGTVVIREPQLKINGAVLASLTERINLAVDAL